MRNIKKGKTYEEIYGEFKAKKIRQKQKSTLKKRVRKGIQLGIWKKGQKAWNKGKNYKLNLTPEQRKQYGVRASKNLTGKKLSKKHRKKLSMIKKKMYRQGKIFLPSRKGTISPMRGRRQTPEAVEKNRLSHLGKKQTKKSNIKRSVSMKGKNLKNKAFEICYKRILNEMVELENQGFRCIPLGKVIPDIIAIKDGKIYAVEVEYQRPKYEKYTQDIRKRFDDIIWIIKNNKYIKK